MTKKPKSLDRPQSPDGRHISRDEAALWQRVTEDIKPMSGRPAPEVEAETADIPPGRRPPAAPPSGLPRGKDVITDPFVSAGVDKRTATRLKRGKLAIDGRIDLHGLTQEEAYRALTSFLAGAQESGRRCVLVITGKGLRPDGRVGVIRAAVPRWLNQPPNRQRILEVSPAAPKDGGEGALYVLLRRKR